MRRRRGGSIPREPGPLEQIPVWGHGPEDEEEPVAVGDVMPIAGGDGVAALLAGLNADQRRAVCYGKGPLLVVAGAGTGKTQVITRRIAWLIGTRRARPSEILALTFTDKAADEMQARVDQLVPYGYTDAAISTFHAFGDRIVREYALELGLPTDLRVLSRPEVVIFLRERLFEFELDHYRPLGDPTRFLSAMAALFSRFKDEDVGPAAYLEYATVLRARAAAAAGEGSGTAAGPATTAAPAPPADEALAGDETQAGDVDDPAALADEARRHLELARAYERYQSLLRSTGFMDFGDQVSLTLRLLRESPAARLELQKRFRYVLVDEFQDTNRAQSELVELLAALHGNITVVGDDDQSIYKFRGAAISNILEFKRRHPRARQVVLRRNYRSRAPILEASYRLIRFNDPDRLEVRNGIDKRLIAERRGSERPARHVAFATGSDEADWVARDIADRVATGARPRDHAVLVRANADADPVLRSLNMAGIPWRFSGTSGLYARPEIRILLAFLRAVGDPSSSVDLYALAASNVYGLGGPDLAAILNAARRRNRSFWEVAEELTRQPGLLRLEPASRAALERLVKDMIRFTELAQERPAGEVLYQFLRESGILGRLAKAESVAAEEALQNVARFFDIIRAQSDLLPDDRVPFVAKHLQTLIDAGDDPATAELDADADAVAVLTVHKAKGLEFPVVYMTGLVDGRFPPRTRRETLAIPAELVNETLPEGDAHVQEERRLFYVGMTRARDELILTHAADYGGRRTRRVSQFVLEALDMPAAAATAVGGGEATGRSPMERMAAFKPPVAPVEPAAEGPVDGPLSLSFYQVDDYLTCPLKYRYVHILRVPIAPHHSIVYGSALHRAVQEFHRRQARGYVMSDDELLAAFGRAWSNEGFLTREHEEARLAAGRAALRRFREAQLLPGTMPPADVERDFSFTLDGDRVRGRMDRVDIERIEVPVGDGAAAEPLGPAIVGVQLPDAVNPALPGFHPERVTITDYKSSDVRDPARARERARDSLQLQIYAIAYQAETGRLPDSLQLWFLESGLVGRTEVDEKRLEKAREAIRKAAAGIRARNFEARPDYLACSYCAFRDICPRSAAK
jgi:DNA helicase II / ATP-dependent DNA helicase PcrA